MINCAKVANEKKTKTHTQKNITQPKMPYIPDHPYKILIIGGSGSGKIHGLINLINHQPDFDKICHIPTRSINLRKWT